MMVTTASASLIASCVALGGTIFSAVIACCAVYCSENRKRLSKLEKVMSRFRDPLLMAAYDLQRQLFILVDGNIRLCVDTDQEGQDYLYLCQWTCFLVGQYFSWTYILRRETRFLRFASDKQNKLHTEKMEAISRAFSGFTGGREHIPFAVRQGEQMAMGESMTEGDMCMGFATFQKNWKDVDFQKQFARLHDDIMCISLARTLQSNVEGSTELGDWLDRQDHVRRKDDRLRELQHRLWDLVGVLDKKEVHYREAQTDKRCKIPGGICFCLSCIPAPKCEFYDFVVEVDVEEQE